MPSAQSDSSKADNIPACAVPPGSVTGEYFIPIAGLPWNTSWQDLKDFARDIRSDGSFRIYIDYVEVYHESTNGWVKVSGYKNFSRAYARLHKGVLRGRALIADNRNKDQWLCLKHSEIQQLQKHRKGSTCTVRSDSSAAPVKSPAYVTADAHEDPKEHKFSKSGQANGPNYPAMCSPAVPDVASPHCTDQSLPGRVYDSAPHMYSVPSQEYIAQQAPVFTCNLTPATPPLTVYRTPNATVIHPPVPPMISGPVLKSGYLSPASGVPVEARKIIITKLPNVLHKKSLSELLHNQIPGHCEIEELEIPHHTSGQAKGHAFVVFSDAAMAKRALEALNGFKMGTSGSSPIQVRLAKEGARPSRQSFKNETSIVTLGISHRNRTATKSFTTSEKHAGHWSGYKGGRQAGDKHLAPPIVREPPPKTPPIVDGSTGRKDRKHRNPIRQ